MINLVIIVYSGLTPRVLRALSPWLATLAHFSARDPPPKLLAAADACQGAVAPY